ncbi:Lytic transglycosylase [Azospirillaceae bacterium]
MSIPVFADKLTSTQNLRAGRARGPADVESAVQEASQRTGVDFAYLLEKASIESSFRTDLKASTSSATGLYQFLDSTWLSTVKAHGSAHGLEQYANAIQTRSDGRPFVADPDMRREILDLRKDARVSALMAAEFTRDNYDYLQNNVKNAKIGPTELYLAHFLGAGGGAKFLNAMKENATTLGRDVFPEAAGSNYNVFYSRDGQPKTLQQIYDRFAAKFADQENQTSVVAGARPADGKEAKDAKDDLVIDPDVASVIAQVLTPFGRSPLKGSLLSPHTRLALAALETPDEDSEKNQTQYGSRKMALGHSEGQSMSEFQQDWTGHSRSRTRL